jgi:antirestriction protein ArdC
MSSATEIRRKITEQVIAALEQSIIPWRRPWSSSPNAGSAANAISKRAYRGINILLLELHCIRHGLYSRWFGTFEQWRNLGGSVRKRPENVPAGEWGCKIVFFRPMTRTVKDAKTGKEEERSYRLLREYTVFCVDQVEGKAVDHLRCDEEREDVEIMPNFPAIDGLIAATKAEIRHGGTRAFYCPPIPPSSWPNHSSGDYVQMPPPSRFDDFGFYYETLMHEMAHWSEIRLAWDREAEGHAMGELIAEMSACFLAAELRIPQTLDHLENHASYLKSWLSAMRQDSGFIFRASSQASKVADFLLGQKQPTDSDSEASLVES